ncbi:DUF305 domain-containing protein [Calidithermus timidus]|jgi:uncharacterized protein (DUF305 family)|uniref:DUF305 domain-containing protein n=1 Tax=Calidithermus timidus TaxID=307124 RepID=UPI00035F1C97|nr:DUF305 domain-containing protein [Calidithermus timidus]
MTRRNLALLMALALLVIGAWSVSAWRSGPEAAFARHMIPHHAQAITLAKLLEARTPDPNLQTLARDIYLTQEAQIGQMNAWLPPWERPFSRSARFDAAMREAMGLASEAEVADLASKSGREAEVRFLQLMIRHHQGAIPMITQALPEVQRELPRKLLLAMAKSQTLEIALMEQLLAERGGVPLEPPPSSGHRH